MERGEWKQRAGLLACLQLNEPKEEIGGDERLRGADLEEGGVKRGKRIVKPAAVD